MGVVESLPGRPLEPVEAAALAEVEGIEAVEAVAVHPVAGGVVAVGLVKGSDEVLVGFHPERCVWEVAGRWGRD
jgi:hypothetical protein